VELEMKEIAEVAKVLVREAHKMEWVAEKHWNENEKAAKAVEKAGKAAAREAEVVDVDVDKDKDKDKDRCSSISHAPPRHSSPKGTLSQ
jgi:hypothetical protein